MNEGLVNFILTVVAGGLVAYGIWCIIVAVLFGIVIYRALR